MINLRNLGDFPIVMKIKGTLTTTGVGSYDFSQQIPFNSTLKAVWAYEKTPGYSAQAGTGGDQVDLQYGPAGVAPTTLLNAGNFMFIFPTLATTAASSTANGIIPVTLGIASSGTVSATLGGYGVGNFTTTVGNPPILARGGIFNIVVQKVTTTAGGDLTVVCELNRARAGANIDPVMTGTYDNDSDIF